MMTLQEAFDKNWQHFVVEKNPPAFDTLEGCLYRSEGGHKCAIGVLLPGPVLDEIEITGFNTYETVEQLIEDVPEVHELFRNINSHALADLQTCHDSAAVYTSAPGSQRLRSLPAFRRQIEVNLRAFASLRHLQIPA